MSHQHLDRLIHQTYKVMPQFSKCLSLIPSNKLYLNYPLQLTHQKQKCVFPNSSTFLKSQSTIRPDNHIFFLQSNEFFSSSNFAGATNAEEDNLTDKLFQLKEKYEIFDSDMINRIKLTLGVQANLIDQSMHLHPYARFILKQKKNPAIEDFIKIHANSGFLKSVLNSNKLAVNTAYEYLQKSFLKAVKLEDFSNAYELVRFYSKETHKLRVIFPFCNAIKHSFEPNCELKAMFLTHRRQTFLTLDSVKEIQPGEQLTINYGNQNNYELFVRYGFTIPNNPFSEFYLPVDFSDIEDIFNTNIDWKMSMFKKNKNLKLKNFVRINAQGKINSEDLSMLKIVFTTQPVGRDAFNTQSEEGLILVGQIEDFVRKTAERFIVIMDKMAERKRQLNQRGQKVIQSDLEETIMHNVNVIQNEEKLILKKLTQQPSSQN